MKFNPVDRRYEDDSGRPLTPKEIRAEIESYIKSEQQEVQHEADLLIQSQSDPDLDEAHKSLLIAHFFAYMANKIRNWHTIAGVIAYGGIEQMNPERWKRIGQKIESELMYLQGFEETLRNSRMATDLILSKVK